MLTLFLKCNSSSKHRAWASPQAGKERCVQLPLVALPFPLPPSCLRGKIDGDKVLSGHFVMPRCDLMNVILQDNTDIYEFSCVSKY